MASTAPVFDKLNLKPDHSEILVLNAPESFEPELRRLRGVTVRRELKGASPVGFALAFVTKDAEVAALAKTLPPVLLGDAVLWFAYPKGTSKRYASELTRDTGAWNALGAAGFETVRMIAIDEDWTAKRLRRAEYIKTLKRIDTYAMSKVGKARAGKQR
jgi:hypothetical protein